MLVETILSSDKIIYNIKNTLAPLLRTAYTLLTKMNSGYLTLNMRASCFYGRHMLESKICRCDGPRALYVTKMCAYIKKKRKWCCFCEVRNLKRTAGSNGLYLITKKRPRLLNFCFQKHDYINFRRFKTMLAFFF